VETNNRPGGVHQVEIVGMSEDFWVYPDWWYANLAEMLREESEYAGIAFDFWKDPTRFTFEQWNAPMESIWYGHVNVPENDHWDPGTLDFDRLEADVITPEDAAAIAQAVWAHPVKAIDDNLSSESDYRADAVLGWAHQEGKTLRIRGVHLESAQPSFNLQTVPDELLLAEVARRFRV